MKAQAEDNIKACIFYVCLQSRKENMLTKIDAAAMDAETVQMLSMIDEEKDANLIITAEGLIQFANTGVTSVGFQPPNSCCFLYYPQMELAKSNCACILQPVDSKCPGRALACCMAIWT